MQCFVLPSIHPPRPPNLPKNIQIYKDPQVYHQKYASLSAAQARAELARLQEQVPWDLARRYLLDIAPGPVRSERASVSL